MSKIVKFSLHGLLTASLVLSGTLLGTQPAFADSYDGANAPVIDLAQSPGKNVASDPGVSSPPSNCNKPFPANPVVTCGYITFSDIVGTSGLSFGLRSHGGNMPDANWVNSFGQSFPWRWSDHKDRYLYLSKKAKDPLAAQTIPASLTSEYSLNSAPTLDYFSRGVYWQDVRSYTERETNVPSTKRVSVSQTYVPPVYKTVSGKPVLVSKGYYVPNPVTVYTLIVKDQISGSRSGSFRPITLYSSQTVTITTKTIYPYWLSRTVNLGGVNYYATPEIKQIWCQTELGPGSLEGPYDHDGTPLNSKIGVKDSDLDAQTIHRKWWTKPPASMASKTKTAPGGGFILMSNIGERVQNAPGIFRPRNAQVSSLIQNCIQDKPRYLADATNQPCIVLEPSHPMFGRQLPGTNPLCSSFVPGNYNKNLSESKEMLCTLVTRRTIGFDFNNVAQHALSGNGAWLSKPVNDTNVFVHCGRPISAKNNPDRPKSPNAIAYPITKAFFACQGDNPERGNRMWHPDKNYNFLTCGYTFACIAPGGDPRPTITDVNSNTSTKTTSQVLASGAQTRVSWPKPTGIGVYDNRGRLVKTVQPDESKAWQMWSVLGESAPWYSSKSPNDPTQPVFGSNLANQTPGSNNSLLNSGVTGWSNPEIYLRGYKGTNVATRNTRIGDLVVRTGDLLPFALDAEYNATIPHDTVVLNNRVTMNMPVTCDMPTAYLYYLSGRATG